MRDAGSAHVQVLVVGAGPAGLVAGITLARYGIGVLVAEKRAGISALSRALVISTRSMEILRSWGLEDQVRAGAADVEPCGWVTRTLASGEGTQIPLGYPTAAQAAAVSPTRPAWAPQDHLEPLLLARLQSAPGAEVWFGFELVTLAQDDDGVRAVLHDHRSGRTREVKTLFVVGADSAHSTVRAQLGIPMAGPGALAEYHSVQFRAPLAQIAADRRYGITVITHPGAAGVLARHGPGDRWHYAREWRPGQARLADCPQEQLAELIATAAGVPGLQPRIERVSVFSFAAQIAGRYRDRRGFLAGDAAHQDDPARRDRHEHRHPRRLRPGVEARLGTARPGTEPGMLASYEAERLPVGLHNVARSADPDGAMRQADQALPWDLNGRLEYYWLRHASQTVSTLDLVSDGLTLLTGPGEPSRRQAAATLNTRAPVTTHALDEPTAHRIGIQPGGAVLLRPDGHQLLHWPNAPASWSRPAQMSAPAPGTTADS